MKKLSITLFLVTPFFPGKIMASNIEDFGEQMSVFYTAPSQKAFIKFQKDADKYQSELEYAGNGADVLVSVMIAKISEKHNWQIDSKAFGNRAKEILDDKSDLSQYINNDSIVDPRKLDIWWASFFATGDNKYLENIFKYVGYDVDKKENTKYILIYGAANWSFKANCKQHEKVRKFAEEQLNKGSYSKHKTKFPEECIEYTKQ